MSPNGNIYRILIPQQPKSYNILEELILVPQTRDVDDGVMESEGITLSLVALAVILVCDPAACKDLFNIFAASETTCHLISSRFI